VTEVTLGQVMQFLMLATVVEEVDQHVVAEGVGRGEERAALVHLHHALDELTQIISLLPPAEPEGLLNRSGTPVKPGNGVPDGVYKRRSAPYGSHGAGLDYFIKLPPEYHHGRAYPVIVALTFRPSSSAYSSAG